MDENDVVAFHDWWNSLPTGWLYGRPAIELFYEAWQAARSSSEVSPQVSTDL